MFDHDRLRLCGGLPLGHTVLRRYLNYAEHRIACGLQSEANIIVSFVARLHDAVVALVGESVDLLVRGDGQ